MLRPMKTVFWAGSYAAPAEEGLLRCAYDPDRGFSVTAGYRGLTNPSFFVFHPRLPVLYTVEETGEGAVCAWHVSGEGLRLLSRLPSGGADPCHLALSADGAWLYAANYTGGSAACFALGPEGALTERTDLRQHHGRGPNPLRQEAAHVHCAFPEGDRLLLCDLGLDALFVYQNVGGHLEEAARVPVPAGQGPRHLAAVPAFPALRYCVTELGAAVLVFREDPAGDLSLMAVRPALPPEALAPAAAADNTAAAIHPAADGKHLLVSHRGLDAIAVLPLDDRGLPGEAVLSPCVRTPRDFLPLRQDVLVASQRDGVIRAYRLAGQRLTPLSWEMPAPCPVCLQKEGGGFPAA